jgi:hypothetical protein
LLGWQELFPTRAALGLALFVCVVAPSALIWLEMDANPQFSPVDETAHYDYVNRIAKGELPRQGQHLMYSTLRELACRKTSYVPLRSPPCGTTPLRYEQFSATYQYEAQQPPTYYVLTLPLRWTGQHVLGIEDEVRATRAANIVWVSAGMLLLWAAGSVMGIALLPLASALLLVVCGPNLVYHAATVTNDITAIPAAGLVALVAALAYRRDGPRVPIALFAAGFVAAALKITNIFPVVALSALFAVGAVTRREVHQTWLVTARRWLHDGGALLAGGIVASTLWAIVHRSRSLIDLTEEPTFDSLRQVPRTVGLVVREAAELFTPLGEGALSDSLSRNAQVPFYHVLTFLLIGAALSGLFVSHRRWSHALGLILVPLLYIGGLVLGLGLMINYDIDPGLSGRYALSMAPLLALVLAASIEGRWAPRILALFSATYFLTMLVVLAG